MLASSKQVEIYKYKNTHKVHHTEGFFQSVLKNIFEWRISDARHGGRG
jgi:hypothetical protein